MIASPTVRRGLSERYGSWKTICTRRRIGRSGDADTPAPPSAARIGLGQPASHDHVARTGGNRAAPRNQARHRADEHPRVLVTRLGEELVRRSGFDDFTSLKHGDAIGN